MIPSASLIGQTFGRWAVLADAPDGPRRARRVVCRCACGTTRTVAFRSLRHKGSASCGCARRTLIAAHRVRHGHTVGRIRSPLYRVWQGIKQRCYDPKGSGFQNYGGRGLTMWVAWCALYECFEQDVIAAIGPHPGKGWSIDRIANDGNYEPGNIRWATRSEQRRNQRPRQRQNARQTFNSISHGPACSSEEGLCSRR